MGKQKDGHAVWQRERLIHVSMRILPTEPCVKAEAAKLQQCSGAMLSRRSCAILAAFNRRPSHALSASASTDIASAEEARATDVLS
jgi:hypothetical protein